MATLDLSTITIPTPEAFDEDNPTQEMENLCYVILQVLAKAKSQGIVFDDQQFPDLISAIYDFSSSVLAIVNAEEL